MDHLQERLRNELASEQIVSAALLEVLKGEVVRPAPEACDSKVVGLTLSRLSHLRHLFFLPPVFASSPWPSPILRMLLLRTSVQCTRGTAATAACAMPGEIFSHAIVGAAASGVLMASFVTRSHVPLKLLRKQAENARLHARLRSEEAVNGFLWRP